MEIEEWIERQRRKLNAYEIEIKKIDNGPLREQKILDLIKKLEWKLAAGMSGVDDRNGYCN
jgi:hypothetical protein